MVRAPATSATVAGRPPVGTSTSELARVYERRVQTRSARALITALPERQRAAIVLTYYEELSNAAAAQTLDMNIKAFESLLLRARTALRNAYAAQAEGGAS